MISQRLLTARLIQPGAIIGDGDHKRAPFLVFGLAPWYGTIFLFLEQIAPLPAAHAHTCCEDFCGCRVRKVASEIPEIFYTFGPLLNTFMWVGILLKYFRLKLLQFEWSKAVSNLGRSRFISLTRLCSAVSFTRTSHYSKSFSLVQQTSWIYLDIAAFQDFKVFLLLPHAFENLATEKS